MLKVYKLEKEYKNHLSKVKRNTSKEEDKQEDSMDDEDENYNYEED